MSNDIIKILLKSMFMVVSDLYRLFVGAKEYIGGSPAWDSVFITNFQNDVERGFIGCGLLWGRKFAPALKFQMAGRIGSYIGINSVAKDMVKDRTTGRMPPKMVQAKEQVYQAIEYAVEKKGARIILFGASTKRLFQTEIDQLRERYPKVIFTIGDNGTVWALMQDVDNALNMFAVRKDDAVAVIGPNGFLGSHVKKELENRGFSHVIPVSQKSPEILHRLKDVKLVVACSHHRDVRLTASVAEKIAHQDGMHVIDVCKPANFSRQEFETCQKPGVLITRQDAGNTFNANLTYEGSIVSRLSLQQLALSTQRLFGCFSEATALAAVADQPDVLKTDFFKVQQRSIQFVGEVFQKTGFKASPMVNFGKEIK